MKVLLLFVLSTSIALASENYCHDKEKINEWEHILKEHHDAFFIRLYALRSGLCKMIDEKKVDLDTAIDIFDNEKSVLNKENDKFVI